MVDIFLKRRYKMRVFIFSASATSSGPSPSLLTFSLMIAVTGVKEFLVFLM